MTTVRIREDIVHATVSFLTTAGSRNDAVLAGLIARAQREPACYVVTTDANTPQSIADDLWRVRESHGDEIAVGGVTLAAVIMGWDELILAQHGEQSV